MGKDKRPCPYAISDGSRANNNIIQLIKSDCIHEYHLWQHYRRRQCRVPMTKTVDIYRSKSLVYSNNSRQVYRHDPIRRVHSWFVLDVESLQGEVDRNVVRYLRALVKRQVGAIAAGWNSRPRSSLRSGSSKLHLIQRASWSSSLSTLLAYHRMSCTYVGRLWTCSRVTPMNALKQAMGLTARWAYVVLVDDVFSAFGGAQQRCANPTECDPPTFRDSFDSPTDSFHIIS